MCLMHCPVEIWNQIHQNKFLYERLGRQQQQQEKITFSLTTSAPAVSGVKCGASEQSDI